LGLALSLFALVGIHQASPALAASCSTTWTGGGGDGSWNNAANWTAGIPSASSDACITQDIATTTAIYGTAATAKSLTLGAGTTSTQTLVIEGNGCSGGASLTVGGSVSIAGDGQITLTSNNGQCGGTPAILVAAPISNGGVIDVENGSGGGRTIEGNLTNTGTVTQNGIGLSFDQAGTTFDNRGLLTLNGGQLTLPGAETFANDTGGSITTVNGGQMVLSAGGTFNQGAGTGGSNPALISSGNLNLSGTGASSFTLFGSSALTGNIGSAQSLTVEGDGCRSAATLTASGSFTNAGSLVLTSDNGQCGATAATLSMPGSTTVTSSGTLDLQTASGGNRVLHGNVVNTGTLTVEGVAIFDEAGTTLDNKGSMTVSGNVSLPAASTFNNDVGGSISTPGSGSISLTGGGTFEQGPGSAGSNPVLISSSNLTFNGTGAGSFVLFGSNALKGNVGSAQTVTIEADACRTAATLTPAGSFTNTGLLFLTSINGQCGGSAATLTMPGSATFTNAGTLDLQTGSGGNRVLHGNVVNTGTLTVEGAAIFDEAGTTLDNKGSMTISGSLSLPGASTFKNDVAGSITTPGSGGIALTGGGTFDQGPGSAGANSIYLIGSHLKLSGGGPASFLLDGANDIRGNVGSKQRITLRGDGCRSAANLTSTASFNGQCGAVGATISIPAAATLTDLGVIYAEVGSGGPRSVQGGKLSVGTRGTVQVDGGTVLTAPGGLMNFASGTLTGGSYQLIGTFQFPGADIVTDAANIQLQGSGAIQDQANNDGLRHLAAISATGSLGLFGGRNLATPGGLASDGAIGIGSSDTLSVAGPFTESSTSTITIVIAGNTLGSTMGQVTAGGALTIAGRGALLRATGFNATLGQVFNVLTGSSRSGQFSSIVGTSAGSGLSFLVSYPTGGVTFTAVRTRIGLNPNTGPGGTSVTVSGSGFFGGEMVTLSFLDTTTHQTTPLGTVAASANGRFTTSVTIPAGASVGADKVVAAGASSGIKVSSTFTVT
jgi:hypothetical protein